MPDGAPPGARPAGRQAKRQCASKSVGARRAQEPPLLRAIIAFSAAATLAYTPLLKRLTGVKTATVAAIIALSPLAGALTAGIAAGGLHIPARVRGLAQQRATPLAVRDHVRPVRVELCGAQVAHVCQPGYCMRELTGPLRRVLQLQAQCYAMYAACV